MLNHFSRRTTPPFGNLNLTTKPPLNPLRYVRHLFTTLQSSSSTWRQRRNEQRSVTSNYFFPFCPANTVPPPPVRHPSSFTVTSEKTMCSTCLPIRCCTCYLTYIISSVLHPDKHPSIDNNVMIPTRPIYSVN